MSSNSNVKDEQYVGPYRLDKVLGKGQTGIVSKVLYIFIFIYIIETYFFIKFSLFCIFSFVY